MTAEVHTLDAPRVSARSVDDAEVFAQIRFKGDALFRRLEGLQRQVAAEAEKQFGSAPRRGLIYITYEEVVDCDPEPLLAS